MELKNRGKQFLINLMIALGIVFGVCLLLGIFIDTKFLVFAFFGCTAFVFLFISLIMFIGDLFKFSENLSSLNYKNHLLEEKKNFYFSPLVFHCLIICVTIISFFVDDTTIPRYYEYYLEDFIFQVIMIVLFRLLAFFNPFMDIFELVKNPHRKPTQKEIFFFTSNSFFCIKVAICLVILFLFIFYDLLMFPKFEEKTFRIGIYVGLFLFVVRNFYMMVSKPVLFYRTNVLNSKKYAVLVKGLVFIMASLSITTFMVLYLIGIDVESFNFGPVAFITFNLMMICFEYLPRKLSRLNHIQD